jgi:hypothetical protein
MADGGYGKKGVGNGKSLARLGDVNYFHPIGAADDLSVVRGRDEQA